MYGPKSECPSRTRTAEIQLKRRCAYEVLIGVDPHKASVAVAVIDEVGEFIEYATFPRTAPA